MKFTLKAIILAISASYVESVREKVYERMISERKRIATQFRYGSCFKIERIVP